MHSTHLSHIHTRPDPDFWQTDLGFSRFPVLAPILEDPGAVEKQLKAVGAVRVAEAMAATFTPAGGNSAVVRQHVLLVAEFIRRLGTAAIADAASAMELPSAQLPDPRRQINRLQAAVEVYQANPAALKDIAMLDRWHALRRCVMKVVGRVPNGEILTAASVDAVLDGVIGGLAQQGVADLVKMSVFERKPGEVLVAFRRPFDARALVDAGGDWVFGFSSESVVLRFRDCGHRVDLTATRTDVAKEIAERIGSAILGKPVTYDRRRDPVTEGVLQKLLERLKDPEADDLQLVELRGEMLGEPGRPVKTLSGAGDVRIERAVQRESRRSTYARHWTTVHYAKVRFEGHRFILHFPTPGSDLELTYSDLGRDTTVSETFEVVLEKLRDDFGADIKATPRATDPATGKRPKRRQRGGGAPNPMTTGHWERLLRHVVDDPQDWEDDRLASLEAAGLITTSKRWFFYCGDVGTDRFAAGAPPRTLDCPGEVVWENARHPQDPFADVPKEAFECPVCGHAWDISRYQPDLHVRTQVTIDGDAAWQRVRTAVAKHASGMRDEGRRLVSGQYQGRTVYVTYVDELPASDARAAARGFPLAVFAPVDHEAILDGATSIASVLARSHAVAEALGSADLQPQPPDSDRSTRPPSTDPPNARRLNAPPAVGRIAFVNGSAVFEIARLQADLDEGHPSQVITICTSRAHGQILLLSLLAEGAKRDRTRHRKAPELTGLHHTTGANVAPQDVYKWVAALGSALDEKVGPGVGQLVIQGYEPGRAAARSGDGYALGPKYDVVGFQLDRDANNWNEKRRKS